MLIFLPFAGHGHDLQHLLFFGLHLLGVAAEAHQVVGVHLKSLAVGRGPAVKIHHRGNHQVARFSRQDLPVQGEFQFGPPLLVQNGLAAFDQFARLFPGIAEGEIIVAGHLVAGLGLVHLPAHLAVFHRPAGIVGAGEADLDKFRWRAFRLT